MHFLPPRLDIYSETVYHHVVLVIKINEHDSERSISTRAPPQLVVLAALAAFTWDNASGRKGELAVLILPPRSGFQQLDLCRPISAKPPQTALNRLCPPSFQLGIRLRCKRKKKKPVLSGREVK